MPADKKSAILEAATGHRALAAAVVQSALLTDPGWFERTPHVVAFWLDVAGVPVDAFWEALDRRRR